MNYDLRNKQSRIKFIRRANSLLKSQRTNVKLIDESNRTLNQNRYIHVLCRILALETGQTTEYAKQVYFKELANPTIFLTATKDPLTGKMITYTRSTCNLSIPDMRKAISGFHHWAADNGYYLPNATLADDGTVTFTSDKDKQAFEQAVIKTSQLDDRL